MASAELQPIYNRLNSISNYHPYTADTFADWSMEAGDTVTVSRNGTNYTSPIHSSTIKWNGSQSVSVESRGEKERGSVTKMSISSYTSTSGSSGGGSSFRNSAKNNEKWKEYYTEFEKQDKYIKMTATRVDEQNNILQQAGLYLDSTGVLQYAKDEERGLYGQIKNSADGLRADYIDRVNKLSSNLTLTASKLDLQFKDQVNKLQSQITMTASQLETKFTDKTNSLQSKITQTAQSISLLVEGTGANAKIKPASITAAINNGGSSVTISADKILIDGKTSVKSLLTGSASISKLTVNDLRIGSGTGMGAVSAAGAFITTLDLKPEGSDYVLKTYTLSSASPKQTFRFSMATTLTGEWSGSVLAGRSYKVESKRNGVLLTTHYSPAVENMTWRSNTKKWDSNYKRFTQNIVVYDEKGTEVLEYPLPFGTEESYNKGWKNAASRFSSSTSASYSDHIEVKYPPSTVDGSTGTRTYYITGENDSNIAYIRFGSTTVAQINHGAYSKGLIDGAASASHSMSCTARGLSNSTSGKSAGSIVKSYVSNFSYITFTISCGGTSQNFYITLT